MTPRVALLVIGDGRDALREDALRSFHARAQGGRVVTTVEVDDRYHSRGFCGAIQQGWRLLGGLLDLEPGAFQYVFHLEEDWVFERDFDLARMADLLDSRAGLAQVALRRGPETDDERAAGGVVETWPDEYDDKALILPSGDEHPFLEHSLFFTTNPSLYRVSLMARGWPSEPRCEAVFGDALRAQGWRFAYWGARDSGAWVRHTGKRRGRGY